MDRPKCTGPKKQRIVLHLKELLVEISTKLYTSVPKDSFHPANNAGTDEMSSNEATISVLAVCHTQKEKGLSI